MNLLTRLARELGAVAKPVDGRLVVVPRGVAQIDHVHHSAADAWNGRRGADRCAQTSRQREQTLAGRVGHACHWFGRGVIVGGGMCDASVRPSGEIKGPTRPPYAAPCRPEKEFQRLS